MWWNKDLFALKTSERSIGGYSIQQCEVEIVLDKSSIPSDTFVVLKVGARVYAGNDETTFKTTAESSFEWFKSQMAYTPELEVPATYDEGSEQSHEGETKEAVVDLSGMSAERVAAGQAAAPSGAMEVTSSSRIAILGAPSVKAEIKATQTIKNGYKLYEKITESDWWWWWIAIDMPDSMLSNGEILYQFVTLTDATTKDSFTVGCKLVIGTDGEAIQYFKHTNNKPDELTSASASVTSKTWIKQAADFKEEVDDISFKAGTTHVPSAS